MRDLVGAETHNGCGRARAIRLILVFACLPLLLHCGGDEGTGGTVQPPKTPVFTPSGTPSAPDRVTMAFGGTDPGSLIQVDVKLGGPTTSNDIFSFSFNVLLSNSGIVRTISALPGTALTGQTSVQAGLNGDKLVIGVTKLKQNPDDKGNGVGEAGATVVSLVFKMDPAKPGTTTLKFEPTMVQDSSGKAIDSIEFDSLESRIEQPR